MYSQHFCDTSPLFLTVEIWDPEYLSYPLFPSSVRDSAPIEPLQLTFLLDPSDNDLPTLTFKELKKLHSPASHW